MSHPLNSLGFAKAPADTRVVVAMSGGVDSSVVAALMQREGYETIGITLQLYDHGAAMHRKGACCAGQDIHDARRVADQIGIPHYVLDYESRFRESVIDHFADAYATGETPIPCIECNREIKFRDLLDMAKSLNADVLATGHYIVSKALPDGRRGLYRPVDQNRDQSYFLYATTPEQLTMLRFPLGDRPKSETRDLARDLGLVVAEKADSQDICFVPHGRYGDIVAKLRPEAAEPGEIHHLDGRILGKHTGIMNYTIGQRKGLGIAAADPLYVIKIDAPARVVYVGPREALLVSHFKLRDVNWLGDSAPETWPADGIEVAARVRSTRAPRAARLMFKDGAYSVEIFGGEEGVAPGQACAIYETAEPLSRVLGGGTIMPRACGTESSPSHVESDSAPTASANAAMIAA